MDKRDRDQMEDSGEFVLWSPPPDKLLVLTDSDSDEYTFHSYKRKKRFLAKFKAGIFKLFCDLSVVPINLQY